jgi:hypothetical protein
MEMVLSVVRGAKAGEDFKLFFQASREFTRIVCLMHKMDVHLEPEFIYCLLASSQWDLQEESLLPAAFQALSKTRQTLKVNLYSPCPDPEPEPVPDKMPSVPLETQNPERETLFTPTASDMPAETSCGKPQTANGKPPKRKREKSAKLTRKNPLLKNTTMENQQVTMCEKILPKNRPTLFQRIFRKWEKSGKLPGKTAPIDNINK